MNSVFISNRTGELVVGIPIALMRGVEVDSVTPSDEASFSINIGSYEPIGWALFYEDQCQGIFLDQQLAILDIEMLGAL